jgi:8-oxo-dGTP pyrophosphatase MutT (NUDIX family)
MQETFERSAGIVLYRESATKKFFLLLLYPSGHWDFVKGKIEKNEDNRQAAIRETREETGITDVEFVDGFEERIHYTYQFFGKIVQKEVVVFLGKTKTEDVKLSEEHLDHIWLEFDDALAKTTYQNAKNLLQKSKPLVFR